MFADEKGYCVAESGYKFFQLLKDGGPLRESAMRASFAKRKEFADLPAATTSFERKLQSARSMSKIRKVCTGTPFNNIFDRLDWPIAKHAVLHAIEQFNNGKADSYLYYCLVGLSLLGAHHYIKYCQCCGWRVRKKGNSRYCPACSTDDDPERQSARTTGLRVQRRVLALLSSEPEYKAFMKVRHLGEDYLLLALKDGLYVEAQSLPCDPSDPTHYEEYRQSKKTLADIWAQYEPNSRSRAATSTEAALLKYALKGYTKTEAARAHGISKAGVTKACQRNRALAAAFHSMKGKARTLAPNTESNG